MTTAISINQLVAAQPTTQQLVDYANALLLVNNYAYAITNQQMPVLNAPPDNYAKFVSRFIPAKQHALNWSNNIFVSVVQLPSSIKNQAADLFNMEAGFIRASLEVLISDPDNTEVKASLADDLKKVMQIVQDQVTTIEKIEAELATFKTNISDDAKTLAVISGEALDDAGADKAHIQKILGDIETFKAEIEKANILFAASAFGLGASIFLGLIGFVCCLIPGSEGVGGGLIMIAVAAEATSIAGTVIEQQIIKDLQAQIKGDYAQIDGIKQDIIQLNAVSSQFDDLFKANLKAMEALTTIKTMWHNLDDAIQAVSSELTAVNRDNTSAQYQQALSAFEDAELNWKSVVDFADALAGIEYSWQDAKGTWHKYGEENPTADSGLPNMVDKAA